MFFPDKEAGYREAFRVLVSKGRYLFSVWYAIDFHPHGRIMSETLAETFKVDPPPFLRVGFGSAAIDPIKTGLLAAGFEAIRVDVVRMDGAIADSHAFARGMVKGNPLAEQIASRGVDGNACRGHRGADEARIRPRPRRRRSRRLSSRLAAIEARRRRFPPRVDPVYGGRARGAASSRR